LGVCYDSVPFDRWLLRSLPCPDWEREKGGRNDSALLTGATRMELFLSNIAMMIVLGSPI